MRQRLTNAMIPSWCDVSQSAVNLQIKANNYIYVLYKAGHDKHKLRNKFEQICQKRKYLYLVLCHKRL